MKASLREFWDEQVADTNGRHVINGWLYRRSCEDSTFAFRGFGGRTFRIRVTATGETVTTTNLWSQGEVPAEYRDLLPDDAEFVPTTAVAE